MFTKLAAFLIESFLILNIVILSSNSPADTGIEIFVGDSNPEYWRGAPIFLLKYSISAMASVPSAARLVVSYHSMVFLNPVSKSVVALKSNEYLARVVSKHLRGCPSGRVESHLIMPLNPTRLAIIVTKFLMEISVPAPILTGSALLYISVALTIASAASSTYRNSRVAAPVPQHVILSSLLLRASMHFLIRAGMTCDESGSKLSCGPYRLTGMR